MRRELREKKRRDVYACVNFSFAEADFLMVSMALSKRVRACVRVSPAGAEEEVEREEEEREEEMEVMEVFEGRRWREERVLEMFWSSEVACSIACAAIRRLRCMSMIRLGYIRRKKKKGKKRRGG